MTLARFCLAAALLLPLAGCGGDEPPPRSFAPLQFSYLSKLRLNVGSVSVRDNSQALGEADVSALAPVPPARALAQMARERLFAAGLDGEAVFTIDQASIVRDGANTLDGQLSVHLDVTADGGKRTGYAEARVTRQHVAGSEEEDQRAVLYDMTRQMMADMNVELEYQIRRSLAGWLESGVVVPSKVMEAPLQPPPPTGPDTTSVPGAVLDPAPPPPPTGYLHLPGPPP